MVKRAASAEVVAKRDDLVTELPVQSRLVMALLDYSKSPGSTKVLSQRYRVGEGDVKNIIREYKAALPRGLTTDLAIASTSAEMFARAGMSAYNPSELVSRKGLSIFDRMRKDDQIKAAQTFKKLAALSSGWEIQPPEGKSKNDESVQFLEYCFRHLDGTLEEAILDMMTAYDYGYAVAEQIYTQYEEGPHKGMIGLKALKTRSPHTISFKVDKFGNLDPNGIIQDQMGKKVELPTYKFAIMVHQKEFGNWYGRSDLESAYRAWWIKENAYRWLAMLLERFGIPPIFALYTAGKYTPQQVDALQNVITKLQAATAGAIPRATKEDLELWAPELGGQTTGVFIPALNLLNQDIARSLLMPNLLGVTVEQSTGSFARSQVSFDVFMLITEFNRNTIEETVMNEQIVRPICALNFEAMEDYPKFKFMPYSNDLKAEMLNTWGSLVGQSVVHTQPADEDHIREQFQFPPRDKKFIPDELPPAPGMPDPNDPNAPDPNDPNAEEDPDAEPGDQADDDDDDEEDGEKVPPGKKKPPKKKVAEQDTNQRPRAIYFGEPSPPRQPNKLEIHVDFAQIKSELEELEAKTRARMVPVLVDIRDKLMRYLTRNFDNNFDVVKGIKEMRGINALREPVERSLLEAYEVGHKSMGRELQLDKRLAHKPSFSPKDAVKYLKTKRDFVISGVNQDLTKKVQNALVRAIDRGENITDTVNTIEKIFEPYVGNSKVIRDGEQIEPYRIETIIRTNATDAYNRGRLIAAREAGDFIVGYEYSAILDDRTTEVCRYLDGKVFRRGDTWLESLKPPRHFNCRSIIVPLTIDNEIDEEDFITDEEAGAALDMSGEGFGVKQSAKNYCEHLDHYFKQYTKKDQRDIPFVYANPNHDEKGRFASGDGGKLSGDEKTDLARVRDTVWGSGKDFRDLNQALREHYTEGKELTDEQKDQANLISAAIDKYGAPVDRGETLYRGMQITEDDPLIGQLKSGKTIEHGGFMHTTTDAEAMEVFAPDDEDAVSVIFELTPGVSQPKALFNEEENEYTFNHRQQLMIKSVVKSGTTYRVKATIVKNRAAKKFTMWDPDFRQYSRV